MQKAKRVCVVGGGFSGIQAVRQLARRVSGASITLIDKNEYATLVPALPDVLSGRVRREALVHRHDQIVGSSVTVVHDEVLTVDRSARELIGRRGRYPYDVLVLTGGSVPEFHGFSAENGRLHTVHTYTAVNAFRSAFTDHMRTHPTGTVLVVGAGYTGLEVAASLRLGVQGANVRPRLIVVEAAPEVLPFLSDRERTGILSYLTGIDVELKTGTKLIRYADGTAYLSDGTEIPDALVCWAAGMCASISDIQPEIVRTTDGRIEINEFLQLPGHPEVFIAGDAAAIRKEGSVVRRAVNFAFYSGRAAGRNAAAVLCGRRLRRFSPVDLGWVIPLGRLSVGRVFGFLRVGGALGLRVHYTMCGFRHFRGARSGEFYRTALRLDRVADPLDI